MIKYKNYSKNKGLSEGFSGMPYFSGETLQLFGSFFYLVIDDNVFWFRFFGGYGLWGVRNKNRTYIPFSERYGHVKVYKLFGWTFKILRKYKY